MIVHLLAAAAIAAAAPAHRPAPDFRPLAEAPAAVAHEAVRVSRGMAARNAGGAGVVFGCWDRGGRLRYRCLVRVGAGACHVDLVAAIGREPIERHEGGRVTVRYGSRMTTQRVRVVASACPDAYPVR